MAGSHACGALYNWEHSSKPCFQLEDGQFSRAQVRARVAAVAAALRSLAPVGTCVAFAGANSHRVLETFMAISAAGGIVCPINSRWSPREVQHAINLTQASILVADASFTDIQAAALAANPQLLVVTISPGGGRQAAQECAAGMPPAGTSGTPLSSGGRPPARVSERLKSRRSLEYLEQDFRGAPLELRKAACDTALICFTSGTTAAAKGVAITHTALHMQSLAKLAVVGYCSGDVYLHVAPLFHIGGISSALAAVLAGAQHAFLPKFTAEELVRGIRRHRASAMIAVPTMLQDLVQFQQQQQPSATTPPTCFFAALSGVPDEKLAVANNVFLRFRNLSQGLVQLPSMLRVLVGAGSSPAATVAAAASLMPHACIMSAYGMTEATSSITFDTLAVPVQMHDPHASGPVSKRVHGRKLVPTPTWLGVPQPGAKESHCVGAPAPGFQVAIAIPREDQENPSETSAAEKAAESAGTTEAPLTQQQGRVGEVVIRGAAVTSGYWGDAGATARAIDCEGWLHTGDLGWFDGYGNLMLCGRQKDMIKSGGENVHASEVEAALAALDGVQEAAVVGVPHARFGEAVAALLCVRMHAPHASQTQSSRSPSSSFQEVPGVLRGQGGGHGAGGDGYSNGATLMQGDALAWLQVRLKEGGLSAFKVPRVAAVSLQPLPRTATGKVDKHAAKGLLSPLSEAPLRSEAVATGSTWHRSAL